MNSFIGKKILVVDDEVELCEILADEFTFLGAEVLQAHSGQEAFALFNSHKFDLVLSDVNMPHGNGFELLSHVRNIDQNNPIFFLTTGYSDHTLQDAYDAGAEAIFSKPFNFEEIIERANYFLEPLENRLRTKRFELNQNFKTEITLDNLPFSQSFDLLNISRGGMFIASDSDFPKINEMVHFNIKIKNSDFDMGDFSGIGLCRWVRKSTQDEKMKTGYGLEFIYLEPQALSSLHSLLDRLQTTSFIPKN
jgi:DNA-binding response OmpR family regulator